MKSKSPIIIFLKNLENSRLSKILNPRPKAIHPCRIDRMERG
jgi:hypothetical protein